MFCWRADNGPALNADRAAFEFSLWEGSIPVFSRHTFLDPPMQSYNRTLDLHTSTNIKLKWPASKMPFQRRFAGVNNSPLPRQTFLDRRMTFQQILIKRNFNRNDSAVL